MRGREPLATFSAASLEHEASILGRHARAKAVRLCAAAIVRLKGSLRHSQEFSTSRKRPSLMAHEYDVKAGCSVLDASQNRVLAFKAFGTHAVGHCITEDPDQSFSGAETSDQRFGI